MTTKKKEATININQDMEDESENIRQKFAKAAALMNKYCVDQGDVVKALILATISRNHCIFIGPPGCNKTGAIDIFAHLLGANDRADMMRELVDSPDKYTEPQLAEASFTFMTTLDKYTQPEALLGPISLKEMRENDKWVRKLSGTIAEADFAFIGEIFSASGATLRSVVRVLNEREVENGGVRIPLRLRTVFADSNYEAMEQMEAIYDRFLLRLPVSYIPNTRKKAFMNMLSSETFDKDNHTPLLSLEEVDMAYIHSDNVVVDKDLLETLFMLRGSLRTENEFVFSDRRWRQSLSVLKASAWLRGSKLVEPCDIHTAMRFILFSRTADFAVVEKLLEPYKEQKRSANEEELYSELERVYNDVIDSANEQDLITATLQFHEKATSFKSKDLRDKIEKMMEQLDSHISSLDNFDDEDLDL